MTRLFSKYRNMSYKLFITRFPQWLPYLATLYYVDFMFILPRIAFAAGKTAATIGVLLFTFLWTFHVIALYYRKEINRKIHLFFIEIDFAFRLALTINFVFFHQGQRFWYETFVFFLNLITLVSALFVIYFLTDKRIKELYN